MGVWAANAYRSGFESLNYLVTAAVSLLVAGLLARYAVLFARRARRIGLDSGGTGNGYGWSIGFSDDVCNRCAVRTHGTHSFGVSGLFWSGRVADD